MSLTPPGVCKTSVALPSAVKLLLLIGLWREKLWSYPLAIVVFTAFIAYQLYRFSFTHSPSLLLLTLMDFVVIWLTWHEYVTLRRHRSTPSSTSAAASLSVFDRRD